MHNYAISRCRTGRSASGDRGLLSWCEQRCTTQRTTLVQEDRLAELASDNTRRERLEAAAAQLERERDRECTFQPVLSSGMLSLSDRENQNPAAEVSASRQVYMVRHIIVVQRMCTHYCEISSVLSTSSMFPFAISSMGCGDVQ